MIERYACADIGAIWSDEARLRRWVAIWREWGDITATAGAIPRSAVEVMYATPPPDAEAASRLEAEVGHDVVAALLAWEEQAPVQDRPYFRYAHYCLTSSDVVDTATALAVKASVEEVGRTLESVLDRMSALAKEHCDVPMPGRTHGQYAAIISWGHRLQELTERFYRAGVDLHADAWLPVMASGPVGAYAGIDPAWEAELGNRLGLPCHGQVTHQALPRDYYTRVAECALRVIAACENLGYEWRLGASADRRELVRTQPAGEVGSSSMPTKNNTADAERLTGLARLARGYADAIRENGVSWNQRDISASSVERVALPDLFHVTQRCLREVGRLLECYQPDAARMRHNVEANIVELSPATIATFMVRHAPPNWDRRLIVERTREAVAELHRGVPLAAVFERMGLPGNVILGYGPVGGVPYPSVPEQKEP